MNEKASIAVIGGSGVYDMGGVENKRHLTVATPFGEPSDQILIGEVGAQTVAFLPRHGRGHRFTPSEIPYRANIYALRSLGVQRILSVSAVGSLCHEYTPGVFVMVDQFIDRTYRRAQTFFGDGIVAHVPLGDPICDDMRQAVAKSAQECQTTLHQDGTYVCIEGPQFSTRAESELFRKWGAKIVGMTNVTEAKLAREAGISFACIAMVTDFDCWHPEHDNVDVEQVIKIAHQNARNVQELVIRAIPHIAELGDSPWRSVLNGAVMTSPDLITPDAKLRTAALFEN